MRQLVRSQLALDEDDRHIGGWVDRWKLHPSLATGGGENE